MKNTFRIVTMITILQASSAFAANPAVAYESGILVSVFIGVCALIVVAQLVPALMLLTGFMQAAVVAIFRKEAPMAESTPNRV